MTPPLCLKIGQFAPDRTISWMKDEINHLHADNCSGQNKNCHTMHVEQKHRHQETQKGREPRQAVISIPPQYKKFKTDYEPEPLKIVPDE